MKSSVEYMQMALKCAREVKGTTAPNPSVGAVIVRDGEILGKGATAPAGGPHAEVQAIANAGGEEACAEATLYVTLEPCSHWGRTPPCSEAVIRSGFSKVYVAVLDPNPEVAGRGIGQISEAGIEVEVGLLEAEAFELNEDFFHYIIHKKPFVHVKMALTLDGKICDVHGGSKWITGPDSRAEVHRMRSSSTAIAVGKGTLLADNPKLNVRHVDGTNPIRIVFGSAISDIEGSYFLEHANEVRSILVLSQEGEQIIEKHSSGVEIWNTGSADKRLSMQAFMIMAGEQEIDSLFVEGGAGVVATLLEERLVHRLSLFYGTKILGGGTSGISLQNPFPISAPITLEKRRIEQYGADFLISGIPHWE